MCERYVDKRGNVYRLMREIGSEKWQIWRKPAGGAMWRPCTEAVIGRDEARRVMESFVEKERLTACEPE